MALSTKLITAFLACGVIPLSVVAFISYSTADHGMEDISTCGSEALSEAAFNQFTALRDVKKGQIENYFAERQGDMGVLVETVNTLRSEAFQKLEAVRQIKRSGIERYFNTIRDQVITFSEDGMIVEAMRELSTAFRSYREDVGVDSSTLQQQRAALRTYYTSDFSTEYQKQNDTTPSVDALFSELDDDAIALQYAYIKANRNALGEKHKLDAVADNSTYSKIHARIHPVVRNFLEKFGYYDIFLVDAETGDIVYSVFKELDYGTSLIDGPYADTNFAEAFRQANAATDKHTVAFVDYKCYTPSYEAPASFIASPIYDGDQKVGVAMFQMPLDRINEVMAERAGLGETGETYLVGPDYLMRSDSFLDPEHHSVIASFRDPEKGSVETDAARAALAGETGARVIPDYNGNPVLSAYCPVELCGVQWALLTEVDVAEAFCPRIEGAAKDFFTQYTEQYGYYDLFLMNPDGYCFYTVAKEADYQTNFVDGKYQDSNLGTLVRQVLSTKNFGFADFRPYAPSNGAQAAFIAQPVVSDGNVEAVVALQVSTEDINSIMNVRTGMGDTGCTYLIGTDPDGSTSFRSDLTFMDDRYVIGYDISTPYIEDATRSHGTEHGVYKDSKGNGVVVAYTSVDVYGEPWALIAKVDEVEALAAVSQMQETAGIASATLVKWVSAVGVLAAVIVGLLSVLISRSISKPINHIIAALNEGAEQVNSAAGQVSSASQQLAEGASEQASSLEETSSALEQMAAMTRTNAENAKQANDLSEQTAGAAQTGDKTMGRLNDAMTAINSSAGEISKIIKVIEEIAFQTNLLALNAAVEAARAGEHGKGFAVVAEEVRNLAMRAAEAARETTGLIEGSVARAKEGSEVAGEVGEALGRIVGDVGKVTELINGIARASEEQAQGVEQVNTAVSQMDKVTQQNAAGAEESASASEELSAQAVNVKAMVNDLVALVRGTQSEESRTSRVQAAPKPSKRAPAARKSEPSQAASFAHAAPPAQSFDGESSDIEGF